MSAVVYGDTISYNLPYGILVDEVPGTMHVSDCVIEANGPAGIRLGFYSAAPGGQATAQAESMIVENCTIAGHEKGIWRTGGSLRATWCQFSDNSAYGVLNDGAGYVDARLNCWGHPSGPGGAGPGLGDAVSDLVLYDPWLANGVRIASSSRFDPTADNNARRIVRDECPPYYKVVYTDGDGVWIVMASDPVHGPWTAPVEIWPVDMVHHSTHPAIAIEWNDRGAGGNPYSRLHLVWAEHVPDETAPGDIYYACSDDGGFSWGPAQDLSNSPGVPSEHPSVAVDGTDVVHVVWDEHATLAPDIFYVSNSGHGWTEPLLISPSSLADIYPAIASNYQYHYGSMPPFLGDDRVHIAWTSFAASPSGGNSPWIAYRSYDPIWGWIPPLDSIPEDATQGMGGASASIIAYPSMYEVGRAAAVVWQSPYSTGTPPAASDIYFNERTPGVWGLPRAVWAWIPDARPSRCASLALQAGRVGDTLWTVWEEWDVAHAGRSEIYSCYSGDFGDTWNFYLNLSQTPWDLSLYPSLAYQKGVHFAGLYDLAWTEIPLFAGAQGFSQVYYIGATSLRDSIYAGVPGEPEPAGLASPFVVSCRPNPVLTEARFVVSGTGAAPVEVSIYDTRGRLTRSLVPAGRTAAKAGAVTWDVRDAAGRSVAPGIYFYEVRCGEKRATGRLVVLR